MIVLGRNEAFAYGYHWVGEEEAAAEQIEFARRLLYLPVGSKVLMPFCGPGWYAHELAMWGFSVVGVERVRPFVVEAQQRSQRMGLTATFFLGDPMRLPLRSHQFDGVMSIGNRFGLTGEEAGDKEFLTELARVLKPQARLVLSLPHRDGLLHRWQERDWETLSDGSRIFVFRQWDPLTGQVWEEWHQTLDTNQSRLFVVIYRVYTATELEQLLRACGFRLTNAFGSFLGSPLSHESRWMLVQAMKE